MSENLKKFLEAVSKDENLREKAKAFVKNEDKEQAIAAAINLAKQLGIELAEADFEAPKEEISEEELAVVSGGKLFERSCPEAGQEADGWCFCVLPGGGGGTMLDDGAICGCACVGYGQGGDAKDDHWVCYCTAMGAGC